MPDDVRTVSVTLEVEPEIAAALEDPATRAHRASGDSDDPPGKPRAVVRCDPGTEGQSTQERAHRRDHRRGTRGIQRRASGSAVRCVIVFDVSALVGAAIRRNSVPEWALRLALRIDQIAVSEAVIAELHDVFARPRLQRFLNPELRDEVLSEMHSLGLFFAPSEPVADCRDLKDNKYLKLALAAAATTIVSSDDDLLILDSWRGVRILKPAAYLAETERDR